jgi:hypothetical protein
MTKRLLVLCIIVAMGFSVTGATCLKSVQSTVCAPPPNVMALAKQVAPIIQMVIMMAVPGSAAYVAAVDAAGIVDYIQNGLCISIKQLNNLIAFLQTDEVKLAQNRMMIKRGPAKAQALDIQPFIAWRASF